MEVDFGTHLDDSELQGQAGTDEPVGCDLGGSCRDQGTHRYVRDNDWWVESLAHHNWVFSSVPRQPLPLAPSS